MFVDESAARGSARPLDSAAASATLVKLAAPRKPDRSAPKRMAIKTPTSKLVDGLSHAGLTASFTTSSPPPRCGHEIIRPNALKGADVT